MLGFLITGMLIIIASILNFLTRKNRHFGNYKSFILFYVFAFCTYYYIFNGIVEESSIDFGIIYLFYVIIFSIHDLFVKTKKVKFSTFSKWLGYSLIICAFIYAIGLDRQYSFVVVNLFLYGALCLALFGYGLWGKSISLLLKNVNINEKHLIDDKDKENDSKQIKSISLNREQKIIAVIVAIIVILILAIYIFLWVNNKYILTFVLWGSLAVAVIGALVTLLILERKNRPYKKIQNSFLIVIGLLLITSIGVQVSVNSMNKAYLEAEKDFIIDSGYFDDNSEEMDPDEDSEDDAIADLKKMTKNNTGKYQNNLTKYRKELNDLMDKYDY